MPLFVNDEKIDDFVIQQEVDRLRPDYQAVFQDQSPEEQEAQLTEWAQENIIEKVLLLQAARSDVHQISAARIEETLEKYKKEHSGAANLYKHLGKSKADEPEIKKSIELQLRVERLIHELTQDVQPPSEEQARAYYQQHQNEFMLPEQVRAAHIVKHIEAETSREQAKAAILQTQQELEAGKSFEELADSLSDCPGNGGDLGYCPRGEMVQEFEDVVFNLEKDQISDIIETQFGFHIARLLDRKPAQLPDFNNVKDDILKRLHKEAKNKKVENYVDKLKTAAKIIRSSVRVNMPGASEITPVSPQAHQQDQAAAPQKQINSILIKPAGPDCNMACNYCFYLEKAALFSQTATHRMSEEILEELIRQVMEQGGQNISFGWQGGEPTLMGLPFFEKAVALQQRFGKGRSVENGLQTNGILIDGKWAKFLKKHNFLVGLSLDGPEHIHDHYRQLKNGQGSWQRVIRSGKQILEAGVAVNALSVVNDYSVRFPREIYEFHKAQGFTYMQFIPCVESEPGNPENIAPFSVSPEKYGQFLCTLFDLWQNDFQNDVPTTSVRYFDAVFYNYVGLPAPECTLLPACGIYVVVEHNGDVYSCDFFVEPEWKLGNIMHGKIGEMLNSERQREFGQMKANLPAPCKACEWLKYCWGGCTKDRLKGQNPAKLNHLCEAYKMFFAHADSYLKPLAEHWQRRQAQNRPVQEEAKSPPTNTAKVGRNDPCPCGSGRKYKKCCGA